MVCVATSNAIGASWVCSAIPAECLSVNGLLAVWPSIVLYGRSTRNPIEQDSVCMGA